MNSLCFKSGLPDSSVLSKIEWARGFDGYFRLEIWLKWCKEAQVFCSFTLRNATHVFRCLFAPLFLKAFPQLFCFGLCVSPYCSLFLSILATFSSSFSKFAFWKRKNFSILFENTGDGSNANMREFALSTFWSGDFIFSSFIHQCEHIWRISTSPFVVFVQHSLL